MTGDELALKVAQDAFDWLASNTLTMRGRGATSKRSDGMERPSFLGKKDAPLIGPPDGSTPEFITASSR